jgi:hypothetical protein
MTNGSILPQVNVQEPRDKMKNNTESANVDYSDDEKIRYEVGVYDK